MKVAEFQEIALRLERMHERVQDKAGDSFEWSAIISTGEKNDYTIIGVKAFEDMLDDVLNAYIWAWNMKDALKSHALSSGKSANWFEATLSADRCLAICSDIANGAKHGNLKTSRAKTYARLGELHYSIPQAAIAAITIGAQSVATIVEKPELVTLSLPVLDSKGRVIGDAFSILDCAIRRWESLAAQFGLKLPATKMLKNINTP